MDRYRFDPQMEIRLRSTNGFQCLILLLFGLVLKLPLLNFQADGWIVNHITLLANPNQVRPKRFWGVYTKLKIFNMTTYKKGNISVSFLVYQTIFLIVAPILFIFCLSI